MMTVRLLKDVLLMHYLMKWKNCLESVSLRGRLSRVVHMQPWLTHTIVGIVIIISWIPQGSGLNIGATVLNTNWRFMIRFIMAPLLYRKTDHVTRSTCNRHNLMRRLSVSSTCCWFQLTMVGTGQQVTAGSN